MNLVGSKLGKYQLIERLGQGGMAQVYRAIQPTIERPVAIKVLYSHLVASAGFVERFKREARSLGQLQHPHIVQVIDFDAQGDLYYMVMDFIPGKTLRAFLDGSGPLDPVRALDIVGQLAEALAFAHRRGLIHRDIKPGNVLFRDAACTDAVLTDFGIGRLVDDMTMTVSGSVIGTPAYMSPEASQGLPVDARTDLYSLGITLYEMVTGSVPYRGDTPLSVIRKQIDTPLPPLRERYAHLPEPLIRIIERALEKDVARRYQRAEELVADIRAARAALAGAPALTATPPLTPSIGATTPLTVATSLRPAAPPPPAPPAAAPAAGPRRRPLGAVLGLLALVLAVGLTVAAALTRPAGNRTAAAPTAAPQATGAALTTPVAAAPADAAPVDEAPADAAESAPPLVLPETFGALEFADRAELAAGRFLLRLSRVPQPPAGTQYQLWLQLGDEAPRAAGPLTLDAGQILHTGDLEASLIQPGSRVLVSLEAAGAAPDAPGEQIVFAGELAAPAATALRRLLVEEQGGAGRLRGAFEQARLADEHAGFAQDALAAGDLAFAKRHAEHVVNILDGADGAVFGDLNGDGRAENPGDNVGVRGHLGASRGLLGEALAVGSPSGEREAHGAAATAAIDASLALIDPAIEQAQALLAAADIAAAQASADTLRGQTRVLLGGAGEPAAIQAAASASLRLAAIPLLALDPATPAPDAVTAVPGRVGTLSPAGNGAGRPGDLRLVIAELAPPPAGAHYDVWMVGGDGPAPLFLGELAVFNRHGSLAAGVDPAIAAGYERVVVTLEPDGNANVAPGGAEVYSGALNAGAAQLAAQLRAGDGPLRNAEGQVSIAEQHLQLARDAWTAGNLAEAQRHAEHVVNILDGADGAFFGDVNLDGRAENPGDNVGVRGHLLRVVELVRVVEEQGDLPTGDRRFYAEQLIASAERSLETIEATIDRVKKVSASDSLEEAARFLDETGVLLGQVRAGRDADGNGVADQLLAEGGMAGVAALGEALNAIDIVPAGAAVGEPLLAVAGTAGSPVAVVTGGGFLCLL